MGSGDRGSDVRFVVSKTVVILIRFVFANNRDFSSRHVLTTAAAAASNVMIVSLLNFVFELPANMERTCYVMKIPFPYKKISVILVGSVLNRLLSEHVLHLQTKINLL